MRSHVVEPWVSAEPAPAPENIQRSRSTYQLQLAFALESNQLDVNEVRRRRTAVGTAVRLLRRQANVRCASRVRGGESAITVE
jgi:hypothetical protein